MSDEELRALERQYAATPDEETAVKLFNARRRSGFIVETVYVLQNSKNKRYYQSWYRYSEQPREINSITDLSATAGLFKTRLAALKEVKRLRKSINIDHYQLVEIQTMRLETAGPLIKDMIDQLEMELLQAEKETQLEKLKKIETEEQALLELKKKQEKEKLAKIQAKEEALQKKLKKKEKPNV